MTCYAMVQAAALRVTELTPTGGITSPVRSAASRSVVRVTVDEVVEEQRTELLRTPDDEPRIRLDGTSDVLGFVVSADFLRTDPGLLALMTGHPTVTNADGTVVGFDARARVPAAAFGLEVWSRLQGREHQGQHGYTVFPFLKGGIMSGFRFENGLVSFTLREARTHREPKWSVGPYDLTGWHQRLPEPVSRNTSFRNTLTTAAPPEQTEGVEEYVDRIWGGDAAGAGADSLDGGTAATAGPWIVNGGRA